MNKTKIHKKLKHLWNEVREMEEFDVNVAKVCWDDNTSYKAIDKNKSFDDIIEERETNKEIIEGSGIMETERVYKPIKEFHYKEDIVKWLYENQG